MKKIQMSTFISTKLESDSETEPKSDTKLLAKLESNSYSDPE